jgi:hypothetical protein
MRGIDGKRFGARLPLGRHFPLSRDIRGFFHTMPTRVGMVSMVSVFPILLSGPLMVWVEIGMNESQKR